jgi:hypothetical protein
MENPGQIRVEVNNLTIICSRGRDTSALKSLNIGWTAEAGLFAQFRKEATKPPQRLEIRP